MTKFRCDEEQAADLFQGFVHEIVLENGLIARARPMKGHQFRSFLLTALHNFATSKFRRDQARKRQPDGGFDSLDDLDLVGSPSVPGPSPEVFDVAWARWVVGKAMQLMRSVCEESGRNDLWLMFDGRLRGPILDGTDVMPYEQLVERLQLESPIHAQNLLVTAKRMFARCLRSVIAEYVSSPEAIESELRELQIILSHAT